MDNNDNLTNNTPPVNTPSTSSANTNAIVALVTGIVSIVFAFLGLYLSIVGLVCAVVAIIFAIKGRKGAAKKGMATAGLVTGIVGAVLCPIFLGCNICARCAVNSIGNSLDELQKEIEDYDFESNGWNITDND